MDDRKTKKFIESKKADMEVLQDIKKRVDAASYDAQMEVRKIGKMIDEIIAKIETLPDYEAESWIGRLEREESARDVKMASQRQMDVIASAMSEIISRLEEMFRNYQLTGADYYKKVIEGFVDVQLIRKNLGDPKILSSIITKICEEFKKKCTEANEIHERMKGVTGLEDVLKQNRTSDGRSDRLAQIRAAQAQKSAMQGMDMQVTLSNASTSAAKESEKK